MLYGLVAKGVKTGGFNAVDPAANPDQAVFDEEKNWTFEVGSKNRFMDDRLTLNAAAYFIDWKNVQGTEAATSLDAWTTDVVGNIGDAEVVGLELDGLLVATDNVYLDYHLAYSDAEYQDAIYQSSVAGPSSSWGCNNTVCRADGQVDGNQVERTSKWQYGAGLNYTGSLGGDWRLDARIDFNTRSRMYATPLNLAHNGARTLSNANISLSGDDWEVTLWGRNIFDKKYVANSFVLPSFTRYIVGLGRRADHRPDGQLQPLAAGDVSFGQQQAEHERHLGTVAGQVAPGLAAGGAVEQQYEQGGDQHQRPTDPPPDQVGHWHQQQVDGDGAERRHFGDAGQAQMPQHRLGRQPEFADIEPKPVPPSCRGDRPATEVKTTPFGDGNGTGAHGGQGKRNQERQDDGMERKPPDGGGEIPSAANPGIAEGQNQVVVDHPGEHQPQNPQPG